MKKEVSIDGIIYIPKENNAEIDGLKYVIVRTDSAGVHAGFLKSQNGKIVVLYNSRRIWYWEGAASLNQMAVDGVSMPDKCKFPCEVKNIKLTEAIETIDCTSKAMNIIREVPIWEK